MAGFDNQSGPISDFVKRKSFEEVSSDEINDLDALADLLSKEPSVKDLVNFYHSSPTLQIESAEMDPFSFVYNK